MPLTDDQLAQIDERIRDTIDIEMASRDVRQVSALLADLRAALARERRLREALAAGGDLSSRN